VSEILRPDRFDGRALLRALVDGGVDFILVGGLAVGLHGAVRATKDADVVPNPERANLERLAAVLRAIGARQIGVDTEFLPNQPTDPDGLKAGGSFQLATEHGQLDVLQGGGAIPDFSELAAEVCETLFEGRRIRYCSLRHLRQMKGAAGRPVDLRDLEQLDVAHRANEG